MLGYLKKGSLIIKPVHEDLNAVSISFEIEHLFPRQSSEYYEYQSNVYPAPRLNSQIKF